MNKYLKLTKYILKSSYIFLNILEYEVLKPPIFITIRGLCKRLKEMFGILDTLNKKSVSEAIVYKIL